MSYDLSHISSELTYHKENEGSVLYFEDIKLQTLAEQYGTPLFVYSQRHIQQCLSIYQKGLSSHPHGIYYSVKVNSNINLLNELHRLGARFDVVSQGELQRVLQAGASGQECVFSGVGKTDDELIFALQNSIGCINIESFSELQNLNKIATSLGKKAPISLRINPNIDAKTHPYISTGLHKNKFGIVAQEAYELYQWAHKQANLKILGITCHIGSQILDVSPLLEAIEKVVELAKKLQQSGIEIKHLDFGGGIGISYQKDGSDQVSAEAWQSYFAQLLKLVPKEIEIHIEPGRSIVGNGGVLLTQVQYLKEQGDHSFAIVDAAMNDMLRPALYDADHQAIELQIIDNLKKVYDIVGPVCETADFLARGKELGIQEKDYIALLSAGAYCFSLSSNYNSRLKAAEVLVCKDTAKVIRQRETFEQMIASELL
jgi:diaminopimelate decarboxylase